MVKFIIVSGAGNTGKTSSIKLAMTKLGVHVSTARPTTDVLLSVHLYLNGAGYHVGFASGGDTPAIIQKNIDFFIKLGIKLDCIVFACRSRGQGWNLLNEFALESKASLVTVEMKKNANPINYINSKANEIVDSIP